MKTLTERIADLEREQRRRRQEITGLSVSLDGMGQHFDALLERMGFPWPEIRRHGDETDSGSPSILQGPRLKSNRLARSEEAGDD